MVSAAAILWSDTSRRTASNAPYVDVPMVGEHFAPVMLRLSSLGVLGRGPQLLSTQHERKEPWKKPWDGGNGVYRCPRDIQRREDWVLRLTGFDLRCDGSTVTNSMALSRCTDVSIRRVVNHLAKGDEIGYGRDERVSSCSVFSSTPNFACTTPFTNLLWMLDGACRLCCAAGDSTLELR